MEEDDDVKVVAVQSDVYEIKGIKTIQNPYRLFGGNKSRNEARNPTVVLDDKYDYIQGRIKRTKERQIQARESSHRDSFEKIYVHMQRANELEASQAYDKLNKLLPDIDTRNAAILAASFLIRSQLKDEGESLENVDLFEEKFHAMWKALESSLLPTKVRLDGRPRINAKNPEAPKLENQKIDVIRTIYALDNFEADYERQLQLEAQEADNQNYEDEQE